MTDLVGQTIGPYQIVERLGRGGMADVYKAFHPGLAVHRALKVIRPEFVTEEGFMERFQREAQAVAGLRHPNIVQVHDFGVQGNLYYMVMEFIEGHDLRRSLAQHGQIRPFDQVLPIIQQVAAALTYAHKRGVVHRDIKPGNIMLTKDDQVILTDFGIAKMLAGEERMTQTGVGMGTPAYMAPEQARGLPDVGPTADVYSLGIVLYEMLTGRVPFSADTPLAVMLKVVNDPLPPPRDFSPDIPDVLQGVILKATAKKPEQRYATAEALVDGLQRSLAGHPPEALDETIRQPTKRAKATTATPPPKTKSSKIPWLMAGGALLLLCFLAVGGAGLGYYLWSRPVPALAAWQFVVDASSGMNDTVEGQTKMEIAREALAENLSILPANVEAGLRVFGGDGPSQGSCQSTDLLVEPSTGQREQLARALSGVTPGGEAPLTQAIVAAIGDFDAGQEVNKTLIIITAGLDTCEEDAVAQLETLSRRLGIEFDLQLIGLGVAEEAAQVELRAIAEAAGGDYHNAQSKGDILRVIQQQVSKLPDAPVTAAQAGSVSTGSGEGGIILQVADQVTTPEETHTYQFEAKAGQTIYFDFLSADSGTYFSLIAPDGRTELFNVYNGDTDPTLLEQPGTYTLTVDPNQDGTPTYEFILWDVAPPVLESQLPGFGQFVTGKIAIPGQMARYRFEAEAGGTIYFDFQAADSGTYFSLTAPDGRTELFNVYNGDTDPVELEQVGTYVLTVDPNQEGIPNYEFIVWRLDSPVIAGGAAEFGQIISGKVDTPGQIVIYQVEAAAGQAVYFEFLSADSGTYFNLTAPDGRTELFNVYNGNVEPVILEQGGTYTLKVDPNQEGTPAFEFRLHTLDSPRVDGGELQLNQLVSGKATTPGQNFSYTFQAEAGQTIYFDFQTAESGTYFVLTAPDGYTEIFNIYNGDSDPVTLEQSGTYVLTVDPNQEGTPAFEFIVWEVAPPVIEGDLMEFNRLVSGEVGLPGQIVTYQFDGSAGQSVVFNFQEAESGTYFSLTAPDGTEIFNVYNGDTDPIELPQTGTYTLTVDPNSDGTPKYEFALELQ